MTYPVYRLFISIVCLLVAGLLYWVLGRTRLGMMIRAGASNREMISSLGIDINRLYRIVFAIGVALAALRSEEHTSELQSLMRISYAVFCLKKKKQNQTT